MKKVPRNARLRCCCCGGHVGRVIRRFKRWLSDLHERSPAELAQQETYWGLLSIVEARGYKPGWAAHKYKVIWWQWPRIQHGIMQPHAELQDWINAERAQWKRQKKKEEKGSGQPAAFAAGREDDVLARSDALVYPSRYSLKAPLMADDDWEADLSPGLRRW